MKQEINHALELFRQNRFKVISETMIEVDGHTVIKQVKKGRVVFLCNCDNDSRFANFNICRHKFLFMYLPFLERTNRKIDELIEYYKVARTQTKIDDVKKNFDFIIRDLEELKRLKL